MEETGKWSHNKCKQENRSKSDHMHRNLYKNWNSKLMTVMKNPGLFMRKSNHQALTKERKSNPRRKIAPISINRSCTTKKMASVQPFLWSTKNLMFLEFLNKESLINYPHLWFRLIWVSNKCPKPIISLLTMQKVYHKCHQKPLNSIKYKSLFS